jgi:hypothetical protein
MRSLNSEIRSRIRAILVNHDAISCTNLVHELGLNPDNCKRTIHSIMVEMEKENIIGAFRNPKTNKRTDWFIWENQIRKRDRIRAALMAL